jgi:type IV pilus assembly protein PilX
MSSLLHNKDLFRKQSGTVLVISMIFLLLLTIVGLSGMRSSIMNERMSGNMRDNSLAFNAAEAALRNGESWIDNSGNIKIVRWDSCADAPCAESAYEANGSSPTPDMLSLNDDAWTNPATVQLYRPVSGQELQDLELSPSYIVEFLYYENVENPLLLSQGSDRYGVYRISARGVGKTLSAESIVQSTYIRMEP